MAGGRLCCSRSSRSCDVADSVSPEAFQKLGERVARLLDDGDLDTAEPPVHMMLEQARRLYGKTHTEVADCLHNLAVLHRDRDRPREAIAAWRRARAMQQRIGDRESAARSLGEMTHVLASQGAYKRARPIAERALAELAVCSVRDDDRGIVLSDLAKCLHTARDYAGARAKYDEAITLFDAVGSVELASVTRVSRGTRS